MKSLYLVDLDKLSLSHLDMFKAIVNKDIDLPLSSILPFEIFLEPSRKGAFELARKRVKSELSLKNFWVIYMVMELMFGAGY